MVGREEVLGKPTRLRALAALGVLDEPADPFFDRVARLLAGALGAQDACVTLVSEHEQRFIGRSGPGERTVANDHGFCPLTVAQGELVALEDVRADPVHAENPAAAEVGAYLGVPLVIDGEVVGSVCATAGEARGWSAADRDRLEDARELLLADLLLRVAGQYARAAARSSHRERRGLERLNDLVTELSAGVDLDTILARVLDAFLELVGVETGALALCDAAGGDLRLMVQRGLSAEYDAYATTIPWGQGPSGRAAATQRPICVQDVEDVTVEPDPHVRAASRRAGLRASYIAPLVTQDGTVHGTVAAYSSEPWSPSAEQAMLVGLFARTAAGIVAGARLAREREEVVAILQESLRPTELPDVPGLALGAAYHPLSGPDTAGGDFFDVLRTEDDALVLLLGDICGKGPRAAALTALARHTMRAAVLRGEGPRAVLRATNTAILAGLESHLFATAAVALARRRGKTISVRVSTAGHPPPLLVRAAGAVEEVPCEGAALGITDEIAPVRREVVLERGDALVLYTDGLTDLARPDGTRLNLPGLLPYVAAGAGRPPADQAAALGALIDAPGLEPRDDVAVLVLGCS